jgi:hypothetical protein
MNPRDLMPLEPCHTSDERNFVMSLVFIKARFIFAQDFSIGL